MHCSAIAEWPEAEEASAATSERPQAEEVSAATVRAIVDRLYRSEQVSTELTFKRPKAEPVSATAVNLLQTLSRSLREVSEPSMEAQRIAQWLAGPEWYSRTVLKETTATEALIRALYKAVSTEATATAALVSAFKEFDCLASLRVRHAIGNVRDMPGLAHGPEIAGRLTLLQSYYSEENDGRSMNADSIQWFGDFLKRIPNFRKPTLALTDEGYVYAKWVGEKNRLFSVEFYPTGEVSYVVFQPSTTGRGVNRFSGSTTADALMPDVLIPNGILAWVSDAR